MYLKRFPQAPAHGMIVEEDRAHYYQIPYWLLPVVEEDDVTKRVSGGSVLPTGSTMIETNPTT